jgi:hypothetical protein
MFFSSMTYDESLNLRPVAPRRGRSVAEEVLFSNIRSEYRTKDQPAAQVGESAMTRPELRPRSYTSASLLVGTNIPSLRRPPSPFPTLDGSPTRGLPSDLAHSKSLLERHNLVPPSVRHGSISSLATNTTSTTLKNRGKDPLELVYNLTTSTFRHARRSTLLLPGLLPSSPIIPSSSAKHAEVRTRPNVFRKKYPYSPIATAQPFFETIERSPPLLVNGRKSVMNIPRWTREIDVYWRRGLNIRKRNVMRGRENGNGNKRATGETEVVVRRVTLPKRIWMERNALGMWSELWIERA